MKDRRNGVGKPAFKLAPLGNGQVSALTAPDLRVPGFFDDVLQLVISQASTANVWWPPFRLTAFSPPGGSRHLFQRFPFSMGFTICALFGSMPDLTGRSTLL